MGKTKRAEEWLRSAKNIDREIDIERGVIKHAEERIRYLLEEKEQLYSTVAGIENPTYKEIIHKRYVLGKGWEEIADELSYEKRHVLRLHKQAVEEVKQNATEQGN